MSTLHENNVCRLPITTRKNDNVRRVFDYIEQYPIIEIKRTAADLGVSYNTVSSAVDKLVQTGILKETTNASRNRVFSYEEYLNKLSSGAVLGMVDQWWQFYYNLVEPYESNGLSDLGCDYIPLPIMIDEGMKNQWNVDRSAELDTSSGLSITVSCQDIAGALQFVNDLLDSDITRMRFWGEEGLDYLVDENGMFYMDEEQGKRHGNAQLNESHFCSYGYFPRVEGLLDDGINAFSMEYQPNEFMKMPWLQKK